MKSKNQPFLARLRPANRLLLDRAAHDLELSRSYLLNECIATHLAHYRRLEERIDEMSSKTTHG
jgi:hypothetical protein